MTFLELCQRTHQEAGLAGSGPASVVSQVGMNAKIVNWVRDAWVDIQRLHTDWRFLWATHTFPTVAAQAEYDPVADLALSFSRVSKVKLYASSVSDETWLPVMPWDDYQEEYGVGSTCSGRPTAFVVTPSDTILFHCTPDTAYTTTMQYFKAPQVLANNSDTPIIASEFHALIVWWALTRYAQHDDAATVYQTAGIEAKRALSNLRLRYLPEMLQAPHLGQTAGFL